MAMGKNKTGIMAAISAAADPDQSAPQERALRSLPKGTVGSVRAGLGGIQDVPTDKILAWGPKDRMKLTAVNSDGEDVQSLKDSIQSAGQQVPVLLRPSATRDGFFEVIYGRRRILACEELGLPVKALIRTLDDGEALRAKGLENASRSDLSYYERARFAKAILEQGHERADVIEVLAISKNTLSQMERITRLIPDSVGNSIGAAPGAGRPKWMALAAAFEAGKIEADHASAIASHQGRAATSDARLDAVLDKIARRGAKERTPAVQRNPAPGVEIKSNRSALSLAIKKSGEGAEFAAWLDKNLDEIIGTAFAKFEEETGKE